MTLELKPCPFCGQPAVGPIRLAEDGWRVHCGNEPGNCVWPYFDTSRSPDAAVSMWNSRRAPYSGLETKVALQPTTCGYCSYEEADGELIEQCAKCKAADA